MDLTDVLHVAGAYGPSGIIVAWFAWRDWRRDVRDTWPRGMPAHSEVTT